LRERFQLFNHQVERARDDRRPTLELHPVANIDHHHVLPAIELGLQLFRRVILAIWIRSRNRCRVM